MNRAECERALRELQASLIGRCDFCGVRGGGEHLYPVRAFAYSAGRILLDDGPLRVVQRFDAGEGMCDWGTCDTCHRLIESGRRDQLAHRAAKRWCREHPERPYKPTLAAARRFQDEFWRNREGPAR